MLDSDGQQTVEDVLKFSELSLEKSEALTLGIRDFSSPGIPAKTLISNRVSSFIFYMLYGNRISDTLLFFLSYWIQQI